MNRVNKKLLILFTLGALPVTTPIASAAEQTTVELNFTLGCTTTVHVDAIGFGGGIPAAAVDSIPLTPVLQLSDGHRFQVSATNGVSRRVVVTGDLAPGVTPRVELALAKTVNSGFTLISNPFEASDKSIAAQFADAPIGTQVFTFENGFFQGSSKSFFGWIDGDRQLVAGQGAFIWIPQNSQGNNQIYTIQFRGLPSTRDPRDGTTVGFNLIGNTQPCDLVPVLKNGEQVFRWSGSAYSNYSSSFFGWIPFQPRIPAGEAVWAHFISAGGLTPRWQQ